MSTVHSSQSIESSYSSSSIIQKNLNYLMEKNGVDAATLSKELELAISTINVMRRGMGNPTLSTLENIANYFKVSMSDFVSKNLTIGIETMVCDVPLISFNLLDAYLKNTFVPSACYRVELEHSSYSGGMFAITVDRNGLAPFWEKGSILIVDRTIQAKDMDIVIVKMGDHVPCVRRAFINGDSAYIFSKLTNKDDTEIDSQPSTYNIVGVIIKIIINFDSN